MVALLFVTSVTPYRVVQSYSRFAIDKFLSQHFTVSA